MFETYWKEEEKYPLLLKSGDEIAGFALVRGNHEEKEIHSHPIRLRSARQA